MLRRASERTVEIDDMQFTTALVGPVPRLLRRIISIDRDIISTTLTETYAFAILKIDCGKNYHMIPLEDGTPFSSGSMDLAWRSARAKLLKRPSQT